MTELVPSRLRARARGALDDISTVRGELSTLLPRAIDRAAIPTAPDGYPSRAAGAAPSSGTSRPRAVARIEQRPDARWIVLCDPCQYRSRVGYALEASARDAADEHDEETHGSGRATSYTDPTGDAASSSAPADPVARDVTSIVAIIERAARDLTRQAERLRILLEPGRTVRDDPDAWCRSCLRLRLPDGTRRHEPVALHGDGRARFAHHCRWCGEFRAKHSIDPPLEILRRRHEGRRIDAATVDHELAKAHAHTPVRTRPR